MCSSLYTLEAIYPTCHHYPTPPTPPLSGHSSPFEWSILIVPKTSLGSDYHKLDVTNSSAFDPHSPDSTPTLAWRFRNERVDPRDVPELLALGMLGKLDGRAMADPGEVPRILRGIALSSSGKDEDSRSWTIAEVRMVYHDCIFGRKKFDFERVFGRMGEEARRRTEAGIWTGDWAEG
jgi:hypothetical protein